MYAGLVKAGNMLNRDNKVVICEIGRFFRNEKSEKVFYWWGARTRSTKTAVSFASRNAHVSELAQHASIAPPMVGRPFI